MANLLFTWFSQKINSTHSTTTTVEEETAPLIVPVCYDPSVAPGPGICALQFAKCAVEEFIQLHSSKIYKVYMLILTRLCLYGFGRQKIRLPRKETPRKLVDAGSVGIAGEQTGIYPLDAPGGWQLIGKTPISLFDISKEDPVFLNRVTG